MQTHKPPPLSLSLVLSLGQSVQRRTSPAAAPATVSVVAAAAVAKGKDGERDRLFPPLLKVFPVFSAAAAAGPATSLSLQSVPPYFEEASMRASLSLSLPLPLSYFRLWRFGSSRRQSLCLPGLCQPPRLDAALPPPCRRLTPATPLLLRSPLPWPLSGNRSEGGECGQRDWPAPGAVRHPRRRRRAVRHLCPHEDEHGTSGATRAAA